MRPPDPDEVELAAARDPAPRPDDTDDLARIRRVGAAACLTADDRGLAEPPPDLWAGDRRAGGRRVRPPWRRGARGAVGPAGAHVAGRRRLARRMWWAAGAAAPAVLVVVAGAVLVTRDGDGDAGGPRWPAPSWSRCPTPSLGTGPAVAAVVDRDGAEELTLDASVARGRRRLLRGGSSTRRSTAWCRSGRCAATAATRSRRGSTSAFPVVDVSIEPPDGEPTHSGRSVLRGVLA